MPTDRYNHSTNSGRPLMPTLATSRTAKTPVTPRLAATASATTPRSGSSASYRADRSDVSSVSRGAARDEHSTPKAYLSSNITPRSSARKSRTGSTHTTPTSTPIATPTIPSSADSAHKENGGYLGNAAVGVGGWHPGSLNSNRPRSVVAGGSNHHALPTIRGPSTSSGSTVSETRPTSLFFHASEAPSFHTDPAPKRPTSTFFYANGKEEENDDRFASIPSPPLSAIERSRNQSKFFHADGEPETRSNAPLLTPPPRTASPDAQSQYFSRSSQPNTSLRPPSPSKESIHLSYRKGASQVIRPAHRPSATSMMSIHSNSNSVAQHNHHSPKENGRIQARRRSSAGSVSSYKGHAKSSSLSSIESLSSPRRSVSGNVEVLTPSPLHIDSALSMNETGPDSNGPATAPLDRGMAEIGSSPLSLPQSPTRQTPLQIMDELAANARRERKVLDLEISNSSLLAINRQLEREVRKQKAELRRYRRLTRAGRFSEASLRRSSVADSLAQDDDTELGLSEAEDEEDPLEQYDSTSESSVDENTLSPGALAERDAKHRFQDEKRLQLDLSKHREFLVDGQKINQSLKKCIDWAEEMLKEGKKALQYKVNVNDVHLGGRVLSSEDTGIDDSDQDAVIHGGTLLSAWSPPTRPERRSLESGYSLDRDSAVELDASRGYDGVEGLGIRSPRIPQDSL